MQAKIMIPLLLIVGAVGWLVTSNLAGANYFYKVDELPALGDKVYDIGLRVKGRIVPGSIKSKPNDRPVIFTIHENDVELVVHYIGEAPLPDMFKDHAEAVVEGKMRRDRVFEANHLQAKCASKYEAGLTEEMVDGSYPQGSETPANPPADQVSSTPTDSAEAAKTAEVATQAEPEQSQAAN